MAEALAEAIYLLRCPSVLGELSALRGQCLLVALSEPSRCAIPWPFPEEAKQARSTRCLLHAIRSGTCCTHLLPVLHFLVPHFLHLRGWSFGTKGGHFDSALLTVLDMRQGVAGFEDLLKAFGKHGGALSVLSWRRQGMQANQAHRFIAMYAIAQARRPASVQPQVVWHLSSQVHLPVLFKCHFGLSYSLRKKLLLCARSVFVCCACLEHSRAPCNAAQQTQCPPAGSGDRPQYGAAVHGVIDAPPPCTDLAALAGRPAAAGHGACGCGKAPGAHPCRRQCPWHHGVMRAVLLQ